jgi:hypothetical protein
MLFYPENEDINVGTYLPNYTASHPKEGNLQLCAQLYALMIYFKKKVKLSL